MSKEHTYTNGDVTIVWKADLCIHSRKCWKGLPDVFKPGQRPWITPEGTSSEAIIAQVSQCPSGALSIRREGQRAVEASTPTKHTVVEVTKNGPVLVKADCEITHSDGRKEVKEKMIALCRCGGSGNKPFCDGSHRKNGFQG
jgi:uncharacterized Fe-S cluster protein YjdI